MLNKCPYSANESATRRMAERPVRWLLAAIGLTAVGLATIGVFVPGLPTTIFLIIGSYCLTRSCPALERWIIGSRLFRPFVPYLDPDMPIPTRARVTAICALLLCIGISTTIFWRQEQFILVGVMFAAAAIGMTAILMWRRRAREKSDLRTGADRVSPAGTSLSDG